MLWCYAPLLKRIKQYITSDVLLQYQQINWFYQVQVVKKKKKDKKLTDFVFTQLSSVHNFTKYYECKTAVICTLNLCCLTVQEDSSLITLWCVAIAFTDPLGFSCVCECVCVCEVSTFFFFFYTSPSYFLVLIFLPKHSLLQMDKALLNSFIFCCLVAGGLMVFSAISVVSLFFAISGQSALGKKNNNKMEKQQQYALLQHADAVRSWMKAEWEKSYSTVDLSRQKWNSTLPCSQHSYFGTCPFDVHWKLVEVKVFAPTMWYTHTATGETVSIVLLADQHWKYLV